jgi:glutamyl-tRNA reductase
MQLHEFCVLHLSKKRSEKLQISPKTGLLQSDLVKSSLGVLFLDTCQRWIWVGHFRQLDQISLSLAENPFLEQYQGQKAYSFLLKVACGLESEIKGETEIFGQMKEGWKSLSTFIDPETADPRVSLAYWIQKLFEDTKEIRTRYLKNQGGTSYGTLVRKVLKDQAQGDLGPLFLVGAGKIARSIAPYFVDRPIWLWNRDQAHLEAFSKELLEACPALSLKKIVGPDQEREAWETASQVVVCIPADPEQDSQRVQWFSQKKTQPGAIVHLGMMRRRSLGSWSSLPQFYSLDDLFVIQNALGVARYGQFAQALKACEEKSKLRALGASLTIPHGWEDLINFA